MAANNLPMYTKNILNSAGGSAAPTAFSATITLAANDFTGAGANNVLVATAGTNGSFLQKLIFKATGSNTAITVARVFLNNGLTNATAANNTMIAEYMLPVTTASTSALTSPAQDLILNVPIQAGSRIYVGLTVAAAGGWQCTPVYGEY